TGSTQSEVRHKQLMKYSSNLRKNRYFINQRSFLMMRGSLLNDDKLGITARAAKNQEKQFQKEDDENPFDSNALSSSLVQFLSTMVPNIIQMSWVYYFFSGFIVLEFPFVMPSNFK